MDKQIVVELIQKNVTETRIKEEMTKLIFDEEFKQRMLNNYISMLTLLGNEGCSKKIARDLIHHYK